MTANYIIGNLYIVTKNKGKNVHWQIEDMKENVVAKGITERDLALRAVLVAIVRCENEIRQNGAHEQ